MSYAVYLLNYYSTRSLQDVTLEEAWSGHKPSVAHLQVFGCVAYAKISYARMTKLDDKSEKCIYVRYGDKRIGYKLYNSITKKVIISRDVIFKEDKTWQQNKDQEEVKWISIDLILQDQVEVPTILIESLIVRTNEPKTLVHRFLVFNRRNTPTLRSSSSSSSSSSPSSSEEPRMMRNLEDCMMPLKLWKMQLYFVSSEIVTHLASIKLS